MSLPVLFFILVGALSFAAAIGVVASRQPVHSALFLLTHFVTLAVLYVTLEAQFLAAAQVIIYAGGIVVLILFVIMLIGSQEIEGVAAHRSWTPFVGITLGLIMVATMVYTLVPSFQGAEPAPTVIQGGIPEAVGMSLFTRYILPFELAAVLLLVALLGALLLARRPKDEVQR
ncbi:MAG: NADH-quinone oxidoreductase subunit J [Litorilinea sp.]|nr:MAG: NADH-quinone oxidoreductase subunit J [Litorilinea sp.]